MELSKRKEDHKMWSKKLNAWIKANKPDILCNVDELAKKAGYEVFYTKEAFKEFGLVLGSHEYLVVAWGKEPKWSVFGSRRAYKHGRFSPRLGWIDWSAKIESGRVVYYPLPPRTEWVESGYVGKFPDYDMLNHVDRVTLTPPEKIVELPIPQWVDLYVAPGYWPEGVWVGTTHCFLSEVSGYRQLINKALDNLVR